MFKKSMSVILAAVLAVFSVSTASAAETSSVEIKDVSEVIPDGVKTQTLRFYMPDEWRSTVYNPFYDGENLSSCKPGVYWWEGSYNCTDYYGSENQWPGYSISKADPDDDNIYIAEIPADVEIIIFNNMVKAEQSDSENLTEKYFTARQTQNIWVQDYLPGDNAFGFYPDGLESVDGMIFVSSGPNYTLSEYSPVERGSWFYYYGNGQYGEFKTLAEAQAENAVYSGGAYPEKKSDDYEAYAAAKDPQKIKVTVKTKTVSAKSLKNKKATVKGAIKVTKNKGAVSFKKVAKGSAKCLTISKKGVITVKKGTKKGTYTIKVKVTAKETKKYVAAVKTVKVKIKVN